MIFIDRNRQILQNLRTILFSYKKNLILTTSLWQRMKVDHNIKTMDHCSLNCKFAKSHGLMFFQNGDLLTTLKPPAVFGELAILYNCRRTATVTAKTPTKVWKLERSVFVNIMKTTTNTQRNELFEVSKISY